MATWSVPVCFFSLALCVRVCARPQPPFAGLFSRGDSPRLSQFAALSLLLFFFPSCRAFFLDCVKRRRATQPVYKETMDEALIPTLPAELWTHILGYTDPAAEWRLVASRVCHAWRSITDRHDRAAGRTPTPRGIEACRMRLARHALSVRDAMLLKWAVDDMCVLPFAPRARTRLWELVTASGSSACARVLVDAGIRPDCSCGCRGKGSSDDKCDVIAVARRAAKAGHTGMMDILCKDGFMPVAHCTYFAMWDAVESGDEAILQFLYDRKWIGDGHPTPKCTGRIISDKTPLTWVGLAALNGRLNALKWLVAHRIDTGGLNMALVHALRGGRTHIVSWLCERHHMEHFAAAFAMGLKYQHYDAVEAATGFRREARTYYEADGDTLGEAVRRAMKDLAVDAAEDRVIELLRRVS
nr:hypothetical protein [Pandoravirus massiliensis]